MSKYVTDRNGITIGWDNLFFFRDLNGEMQDFRAIVVFEKMYPSRITTLNYRLESFAIQLAWRDRKFVFPTTGTFETSSTIRKVLSPWYEKWLDENAPGWGVPPQRAAFDSEAPTIFFTKISHARKFRAIIADHLEGMPSVKTGTLHGKKDKAK